MRKFAFILANIGIITTFINTSIAVAAKSNSDLENESTSSPPKIGGDMTWDIIKVFLALGVVIFLMMILLKWLNKRNRVWSNQQGIKSLGGISLGQNSSIQVVELADRIYIVGVGDQITLIDKEEDPQKIEQLIAAMTIEDKNNLLSVKQLFGSMTNKKKNHSSADVQMWNESSSFEDLLQIKLDKQAERKQELESLLNDNKK